MKFKIGLTNEICQEGAVSNKINLAVTRDKVKICV